jgi:hypothetical protein
LSSSCVLCAIGKSVSGLSILDCPFGFHWRLLKTN